MVNWLKDFLDTVRGDYDAIFVDANPSFSIYTQIALSSVDRLVLPVMVHIALGQSHCSVVSEPVRR